MVKEDFSRSDAAAQRDSSVLKFCVAPLRRRERKLFYVLLMLCLISTSTLAQKSKTPPFDPDGSFWLHGAPPNDFSDFSGINLNAKRSRHLPQPGLETNDGKHFRFKTLTVKRHNFTFTTFPIRGVSFSFSGRFLKGGVYQSGILDDETPVLEGTLTRFRAGKKVAEAKMKFVYFGGT